MNWIQKIIELLKGSLNKNVAAIPVAPVIVPQPTEPVLPQPIESKPVIANVDTLIPDWTRPKDAYHNVRVLCDLAGLTLEQKDIICGCIYQESQFNNAAVGRNKNTLGRVISTDWGICQINDVYQVGEGKAFTSAQDIVDHPEAAVKFMISCFKTNELKLWVSFSSGAYKKWLEPNSPMWKLAETI